MKELHQFFDMQLNKENLLSLEQALTKSNKEKIAFYKTIKQNKKKVLVKFYTLQDIDEQMILLTSIFRSMPRYTKQKCDLFFNFSGLFNEITAKNFEKNALVLLQKINQNNPTVFGYETNYISINKTSVNDNKINFLFFNTNNLKIIAKNVYYVLYTSINSYQFTESLLCLYLQDKIVEINFCNIQKHELEKIVEKLESHQIKQKNSNIDNKEENKEDLIEKNTNHKNLHEDNIFIINEDIDENRVNSVKDDSKEYANKKPEQQNKPCINVSKKSKNLDVDKIYKIEEKNCIKKQTTMSPVKTKNLKKCKNDLDKQIINVNILENNQILINTPDSSKTDSKKVCDDKKIMSDKVEIINNTQNRDYKSTTNKHNKKDGLLKSNKVDAETDYNNISNNQINSNKVSSSNKTSNEQNISPKTPLSTENQSKTAKNAFHRSVNISPCFKLIMDADPNPFNTSLTESEQAIHTAFNFSNNTVVKANVFNDIERNKNVESINRYSDTFSLSLSSRSISERITTHKNKHIHSQTKSEVYKKNLENYAYSLLKKTKKRKQHNKNMLQLQKNKKKDFCLQIFR